MLKTIILGLLEKINNDIKMDNCNMSDDEMLEVIKCLKEVTSPYMSKYAACQFLNISRAKFDNLVREGKLPKGQKKQGFTELFWIKSDLEEAINKIKNNK